MTPDPPADLERFFIESNRIAGIKRLPLVEELRAALVIIEAPAVTTGMLVELVHVLQPGSRIRDLARLDGRVGSYLPPPGGPGIPALLTTLLQVAGSGRITPFQSHIWFLTLRPFTAGNGRAGRLLWLWHHARIGTAQAQLQRGFLHAFYEESLAAMQGLAGWHKVMGPLLAQEGSDG